MIEWDNNKEVEGLSDEEMLTQHVIDGDHELHFLDCVLSDIFGREAFMPSEEESLQ